MSSPLSKLEAHVEALVEGTFARWFANRLHPKDVAVQLARALEDTAAHGQPATRYIVRLHPEDAAALLLNLPELPRHLADEIVAMAREANFTLAEPPVVRLQADPTIPLRRVSASPDVRIPEPTTQSMTPVRSITAPLVRPHAFLIINGERTLPLTTNVLNLGRRTGNDIVIDDTRVSRAHAQLRLRYGHYVVYDLGSSHGTFVNDQRVQECVLRPGDVILLGGVPLIYGEDEVSEAPPPIASNFGGDTQPHPDSLR